MTKITDGTFDLSTLMQRVIMAGAAALCVGAGSMVINTNAKVQLHEDRLTKLEAAMQKVPEIDRNVIILQGKIDVLNQKLDDARDAHLADRGPVK